MCEFPPTVILRHRKENLKKCSLTGLESRKDLHFYAYPWNQPQPNLNDYIVLTVDAPAITEKDANHGIVLIDSTWNLCEKMFKSISHTPLKVRSLPHHFLTAYPRKQTGCFDPLRGLA